MYEHRLILNRYYHFPSYPIDRTDWKCPQIIKRYLLTKLNGIILSFSSKQRYKTNIFRVEDKTVDRGTVRGWDERKMRVISLKPSMS